MIALSLVVALLAASATAAPVAESKAAVAAPAVNTKSVAGAAAVDHCKVTYETYMANCAYDKKCEKQAAAWKKICEAQTGAGYAPPSYEEYYEEPKEDYYEPEEEYYAPPPTTYHGARSKARVGRARPHGAHESYPADHCTVTYDQYVAICAYDKKCLKQAEAWKKICEAQTGAGYAPPAYEEYYEEPAEEYYEPEEEYYEPEEEYYEPEEEYYAPPPTNYHGARSKARGGRVHHQNAYEPVDTCEVTYKQHKAICEAQSYDKSYDKYANDKCLKDAEIWVKICRAQTGGYYKKK